MAFTDDFTGTNGQLLSARTGWTLQAGEDCYYVQDNALRRTGTTASAHLYVRPDDGAAVQRVGADILTAVAYGPVVFATGNTPTTVNCYFLRANSGLGTARVYQINNGALGTSLIQVTTDGTCNNLELQATVNGDGNAVLTVYQNGTQIGTVTDSSANKKTTGVRGLFTIGTATGLTASVIDNYSDNYSEAGGDEITFTITERPNGFPLKAGVELEWELTYTGEPESIEARWVDRDGDPVDGEDWQEVDVAPTGGASAFVFANPIAPGDYKLQVRDGGETATGITSSFQRAGKIAAHWGQSQAQRLFTQSTDINGLVPTPGMQCTVVYYPANGYGTQAPPTFVDLATGHSVLAGGIVALANQIWADNGGEPFTLVQNCIEGTSIQNWLDNVSRTGMTGWGVWDLTETVAEAVEYQMDAICFDHGGSDANAAGAYAARMDLLADAFGELYGDELIFIVHPHARSHNGVNTFAIRQVQYEKALTGGRWRLGAFALDYQADANGSTHQAAGATGNQRRGRKMGRGTARHLYDLPLDMTGPAVSSVQFTSGARTAFDITYAGNIRLADGTAYSGSAITLASHLFAVSTDSGATFGYTGFSAAIVAADRVRITKDSGSWSSNITRVEYLRGIPFSSDSGLTAEYIGPEADMETARLSKVLTDTSSFDGGRGMPLSPIMGTGAPVTEYTVEPTYTSITAPNSAGITVELTKAELATLRVKIGATVGIHEPVAIRWFRQDGDTTGDPVDGVNVAVTVTA